MNEEDQDLKRYYTIGEMAERFGVSKSLIRFWENEFDFLRPHKTSKGDRRFTQRNLDQFQLIYHLVKERGFTLEGAKQEIRRRREWDQGKREHLEKLSALRNELAGLVAGLEEEE
jgi:DNA-binding transcriptional MerR regulator